MRYFSQLLQGSVRQWFRHFHPESINMWEPFFTCLHYVACLLFLLCLDFNFFLMRYPGARKLQSYPVDSCLEDVKVVGWWELQQIIWFQILGYVVSVKFISSLNHHTLQGDFCTSNLRPWYPIGRGYVIYAHSPSRWPFLTLSVQVSIAICVYTIGSYQICMNGGEMLIFPYFLSW